MAGIVYRNSRETQMDSEVVWSDLQTGLNDVFNRNPMTPKRYMELYSHVFNFCTANSATSNQNTARGGSMLPRARRAANNATTGSANNAATDFMGIELYNKLKAFINDYVFKVLEKGTEMHGEELLNFYTKEWNEFRFSAKVIDGIFSYLNRHWIKREMDEGNDQIFIIYTLCLVLWREALFLRLKERVTDAALELIRKDRTGDKINRGLISGVVDSYVELGIDDDEQPDNNTPGRAPPPLRPEESKRLDVYRKHFEANFLTATENFYEIEAQEFMAENPLTEYMKRVELRLREEKERCMLFLHRTTDSKLAQRVEKVLIQSRLEYFQNEFGHLLENRMDEDLARMYRLCERVDEGLANLRDALERHITKEGLTAVEKIGDAGANDAKMYVTTLLDVHKRYSNLVEQAFKSEVGFIQSLDKAATTFVNRNCVTSKNGVLNVNKSPELLSKFCDQLLRKSNRMMDDNELEEMLSQVMVVFKYIEDKDIFSKFYTKFFSKRLITETSASEEAEMSFIGKLKHSCGFEYTNRMSKMISDVQISKELSAGFRTYIEEKGIGKLIDFNILVLSTGSWPAMPLSNFHVPEKMAQVIDKFNKYYDEKHNGRKLTWVYSQSRGELSSTAFGGKKIFTATTAQMAVLMLYNESLVYTAKKIQETLNMDKKTVAGTMMSLVKTEVLKGNDLEGKTEYGDEEEFTLNEKFTSKKVRVDLSKLVMRVDPKQENQEVSRNVDEDRKSVISACIVRIMKMRKTLTHQQLMAEVLAQLASRFRAKVELVKRCIGTLIEKEYIKRSEDNRDVYEYIA